MDRIREAGYRYSFDPGSCSACGGRCCTGQSGYIWATIEELDAIAGYLDLPISTVIKDYSFRENGRFSLEEVEDKSGFSCIFFKGKCTIYDVRPNQCRTFPFWSEFKKNTKELLAECPGVKLDEQSKC